MVACWKMKQALYEQQYASQSALLLSHGNANKSAQTFRKEGTKSIKVTYTCLDCGCAL